MDKTPIFCVTLTSVWYNSDCMPFSACGKRLLKMECLDGLKDRLKHVDYFKHANVMKAFVEGLRI